MLDSYISTLKFRLWKTKGSRFNAYRRLKKKQQASIFSISVLSVYGISIPVIQTALDTTLCPKTNDLYTVISLTLAVFILVLSLLEGANN
ncbi:MAG: SLATT domain-containing protein, partial [Bacteroidota bacterium]